MAQRTETEKKEEIAHSGKAAQTCSSNEECRLFSSENGSINRTHADDENKERKSNLITENILHTKQDRPISNEETDEEPTNASIDEKNKNGRNLLPLSYIDRYSRQMIIKEIGLEGQHKLKEARILVVGAGGLGSPVLMYLAAMGVGHLGVCDSDTVEDSNLNRQVLYKEMSVGQSKTEEAVKYLSSLSSSTVYKTYPKITPHNIWEIGAKYDLVMDCGDNRSLRYLLSDYCRARSLPYIGGSSLRWEGHIYTLNKICYRCVHPSISKYSSGSCASAGIIGSMCGVVGSVMATEAMKVTLGVSLGDSFVYTNGLKGEYMNINLIKKECAVCKALSRMTLSEKKKMILEENRKIEEIDAEAGSCLISEIADKISDIKMSDKVDSRAHEKMETKEKESDGAGNKSIEGESNETVDSSSNSIDTSKSNEKMNAKHSPSEIEWEAVLSYSTLYFVVDIRPEAEQRILPIPSTYLYTLSDIIDNPKKAHEMINRKARNRQIVLCCRNGTTSKKFLGIFNAMNVSGGAQSYVKHSKRKVENK
ncbi:adenylyltransferase and sulfurtransferase [Nematocida minor]|uniref:adenylyltransferase and sulfurtransferase n=1 Tax=Nematocida minor TaxID=1912983 RepID=UPI00221F955C|nr:adenylyltransferase and sulfurtransferase [Nematocida minor]KAI5190205.1 adenylyltransferase and sulfurtransferase [Nematocida minor]